MYTSLDNFSKNKRGLPSAEKSTALKTRSTLAWDAKATVGEGKSDFSEANRPAYKDCLKFKQANDNDNLGKTLWYPFSGNTDHGSWEKNKF